MGNCYGTTLGHLRYALEEASFDETEVICHAVCIDFCIIFKKIAKRLRALRL